MPALGHRWGAACGVAAGFRAPCKDGISSQRRGGEEDAVDDEGHQAVPGGPPEGACPLRQLFCLICFRIIAS
jgi:hypothetical protein